jgi:hypothetical protein
MFLSMTRIRFVLFALQIHENSPAMRCFLYTSSTLQRKSSSIVNLKIEYRKGQQFIGASGPTARGALTVILNRNSVSRFPGAHYASSIAAAALYVLSSHLSGLGCHICSYYFLPLDDTVYRKNSF